VTPRRPNLEAMLPEPPSTVDVTVWWQVLRRAKQSSPVHWYAVKSEIYEARFRVVYSHYRIMPRPGGVYPGPCKGCPGIAEGCQEGYNLLCVRMDPNNQLESIRNQELFMLRVSGTSIFPFKKLWTEIRSKQGNIPWRLRVILGSYKKTNNMGTFFVMMPTWVSITDQESLDELRIIADAGTSDAPTNAADTLLIPQPVDINRQVADEDTHINISAPLRQVTKAEAAEMVTLCKEYRITDNNLISAYIANAFGKSRVMELNTGELAMLTAWIHQEYQPKREPAPAVDDDLPF